MAKLRPLSWFDRVAAGDFLLESVIAIASSATAFITGVKTYRGPVDDRSIAVAYFAAGILALVFLVARAWKKNRQAQNTRELHSLDGMLHAIHAILTEMTPKTADHGLRICVFIPGKTQGMVHQICDYVGVAERYGRNRDLSSRCGVVGAAFRTGQVQYDKLPNGTSLIDHLVAEHGFDRSEAATMQQDRKSWAAVPVGAAPAIEAVIFLDSAKADFFGKNGHTRRKILEASTVGVANFIAAT